MATIPYTEAAKASAFGIVAAITWTPLQGGTADVGEPYFLGAIPDASVQLQGGLGTFVLEGSNELPAPLVWFPLTNEAHTPITETGGARGEQILQSPTWVRPRVAGAAAGVTVTLNVRKTAPR